MCLLLLFFIIVATPSVSLALLLGARYGYLGAVPGAALGLTVGIGIVTLLIRFLRARQERKENGDREEVPGTG